MAHFFSKLIPPRPTFALDMSAEERAVMTAHQAYWRPHVDAGVVIAMGLVLDPKGAYGAMFANVASESMLRRWQDEDPAILSGRGFAFENIPMTALSAAPITPLAPVSSVSP